jgi:hypothetical protein
VVGIFGSYRKQDLVCGNILRGIAEQFSELGEESGATNRTTAGISRSRGAAKLGVVMSSARYKRDIRDMTQRARG